LCEFFEGTLKPSITDSDLLDQLHPTPAVGSYPKLDVSRVNFDCFERGWFSSPIGWLGQQESEFVVGIRSASLIGGHLTVFSGAGIVNGSDLIDEWDEVEHKSQVILESLGLKDLFYVNSFNKSKIRMKVL